MALQTCPKCAKLSFTWFIDEDQTPLTKWLCHQCKYSAFEDESKQKMCEKCGANGLSLLEDKEKKYWWCYKCSSTVIEINDE